jgi:tetratricopeptide (TPR) repeat protein
MTDGSTNDRIDRARVLYEQAVFGGDNDALATADRELDGVEADLALARGRILHARFLAQRHTTGQDKEAGQDKETGQDKDVRELALFELAVEHYGRLGDARGEAEASFWVGIFHQVVRGDGGAALPALERSYELAARVGDKLTLSYAARHLGFAALADGRVDVARERFEESLRLRREFGFMPGVAAALLALAELSAESGDQSQARVLLEEAGAVAEASGARGTLRWIESARMELSAP